MSMKDIIVFVLGFVVMAIIMVAGTFYLIGSREAFISRVRESSAYCFDHSRFNETC